MDELYNWDDEDCEKRDLEVTKKLKKAFKLKNQSNQGTLRNEIRYQESQTGSTRK